MKTAAGTKVPDNSMNNFRLEELESALLDRDRLVQMLTEQLEQAADQLDRLQRMGPERRASSGSSGSSQSPDLFEGQQALLGQLNRVLGDWEELQASQTLTRIEQQVSDIKNFLESGSDVPKSKSVAELWSSGQSANRPQAPATPSPSAKASELVAGNAGWEAIKAAMLAGEPVPEASFTSNSPAPASREPQPVIESSPAETKAHVVTGVVDLTPLIDPPAAIDLETATRDELRDAVQSRDDYIARLVRKLASQPQPRNPDWDTLNQAPKDLRVELENLRDHWQSQIRTAEVDLALQRARLAREESQLQTQATDIGRQRKQLGLDSEDNATGSKGSSGRRWMNFMKRPGS